MEYANSINDLVLEAVRSTDHFEENKKEQLIETLKLTVGDYNRLSNKISKIVFLFKKLNIKSILQTDTDFLGLLYEAFIRYGYDNNSLGIVFTPRHITKYCAGGLYSYLTLTGKLWTYLADLNEQCVERRDFLMNQIMEQEGITEELKSRDQMEWVRRANNVRNRVDEIILNELVYV